MTTTNYPNHSRRTSFYMLNQGLEERTNKVHAEGKVTSGRLFLFAILQILGIGFLVCLAVLAYVLVTNPAMLGM